MTINDQDEPPVDSFAPKAEPDGVGDRRKAARERVLSIASDIRSNFAEGRRVLSFGEYLDLFASHPARYGRSAPEYVRDMFAYYGTEKVQRPWGKLTRCLLYTSPSPRDS